jgi:hypothetical protein
MKGIKIKGIMGPKKENLLLDAMVLAHKFIEAARVASEKNRMREERTCRSEEMAQVNRASLDLSAALIKFRKVSVGL